MLEEEKAIFEILELTNNFIISKTKSDILLAETRYAAKSDLLELYNLSKFANYCRDNDYNTLINDINTYLKSKNSSNTEERKIRLIFLKSDERFYLRAMTSTSISSQGYRDFGINFSIFIALASLGQYVEKNNNELFINNYRIDDSTIYLSFAMKDSVKINSKLSLSFNLILENDEVKRNAVSFNGVFKLKFEEKDKTSEILLKPRGLKRQDSMHPTDLLSFQHKGSVENVFERIKELPELIEFFIKQVSNDANKISAIENPDDVKKLILHKVKFSKKPEFQAYKEPIRKKLTSINVDNTFKLFELLREVEEIFEHDDVVSKDFWRTKLYESLIEKQ